MPRTKDQLFAEMLTAGVVAVIRAPSKDQLPDIATALLEGGVPGIEVTMSTPKAIAGIEALADSFGDQRGHRRRHRPRRRHRAATPSPPAPQFVVSPILDEEIIATTKRYGKISIPGAFTPTEILRAWTAGADVVKVFPSTSLGPSYFKDILAPMPQLRLTPTGGVDLKNAADWIKAGSLPRRAGSSLVTKDAIAKSDWPSITTNAKAFIQAVTSARGK